MSFVQKTLFASLALTSAFVLGCVRSDSNVVSIDSDEAETVQSADASKSAEELAAYDRAQAAKQYGSPSAQSPAPTSAAPVVSQDQGSEPAVKQSAPQAEPKFDAKGVSVDLTEIAEFSGVQSESDLARWKGVKVVRGKGLLTQGALETFARLPQLTEFLWTDAIVDDASEPAFAQVMSGAKLKKVRLTGLTLKDRRQFPSYALQALSSAANLADLDLSGSPLTSQELQQVDFNAGFKALTKINLYQTQVGDAGVETLLPLTDRLTSLNLDDAGIGPEAAPNIVKFTKLTFLHVGRSKLDDASVLLFAQLQALEKVHITRSAATEEGADKLRKALPNCTVVSQPENAN